MNANLRLLHHAANLISEINLVRIICAMSPKDFAELILLQRIAFT